MDKKEEKTLRDTYSWLFDKSAEEEEIQARIDKEQQEYESTEEYKAHSNRLEALWKELSEASKKRREEGNRHRRHSISEATGKSVPEKLAKAKEKKNQDLPNEVKELIEKYRSLGELEKKKFNWYKDEESTSGEKLDPYINPETTKENVDQLHEILVQTALDFISEKDLHDIDEVHFSVDGLQGSVPYGEWCPCTDSYLSLVGLQDETFEEPDSGKKHTWKVRRFIGRSF